MAELREKLNKINESISKEEDENRNKKLEKARNFNKSLEQQIKDNKNRKKPEVQENGNLKFLCQHGALAPCDKCRKLFPLNMLTKVNKTYHRKRDLIDRFK